MYFFFSDLQMYFKMIKSFLFKHLLMKIIHIQKIFSFFPLPLRKQNKGLLSDCIQKEHICKQHSLRNRITPFRLVRYSNHYTFLHPTPPSQEATIVLFMVKTLLFFFILSPPENESRCSITSLCCFLF